MSFAPEILKFSDGRIETLHDKTPAQVAALRKEHEADRCERDPAHRAALDRRAAKAKPPTTAPAFAAKPASGKPPASA